MLGAMALTAFNDNAAITYLATLVPDFSDGLKYAVVAGAVAGGGLTVIANAPNPAGQSLLSAYFRDGVSPLKLLLGALLPTAIMFICFLWLWLDQGGSRTIPSPHAADRSPQYCCNFYAQGIS